VTALLRPDALRLDANGPASLPGRLRAVQFRGSQLEVEVELKSGDVLRLELPSATQLPKIGAEVTVSFDPATAIQVFARD
jgi:ABC-type Fe3+/spermidine/putrescine transport system ATPase subunit